jgi:hypothetical protein
MGSQIKRAASGGTGRPYDLYGVHEAEEVAAAKPASWRVVWLRTGRLNWLVGSGAINSEPSSDYGNHSAGAIER